MLPKTTLKAPPQIDGGTINASGSGKNYSLDEKGQVTVDQVDVGDLIRMGFTQVVSDGSDASAKDITTSVSTTSATEGAQALDPAVRQANQRTETVIPASTGNVGDFGNAAPPHGAPIVNPTEMASARADAQTEAATKAATGSDPAKPSAQPQTGAPGQQAAPAAVQHAAAAAVKEPAPAPAPTTAPAAPAAPVAPAAAPSAPAPAAAPVAPAKAS